MLRNKYGDKEMKVLNKKNQTNPISIQKVE